ncbi:EamA family transporter [Pseudomonas fluorescens]|uniref:EamA family transporter n=1 Tax=Pseudomonas fluorescens TaxID=294 RepID=UPI000363C731|nr:EamA family transporter [Pseudomonas fluorescens]
MTSLQTLHSNYAFPIILSGLANFLLGISSLYWKELSDVATLTLVTYRVILSAAILALFVFVFRQANQLKKITIKSIRLHCVASLLIAANWAAFIWSSVNQRFLESGLGYLLAPFFSVALGIIIFHEPISRKKAVSTLLAFGAVIALIIFSSHLNHWTYFIISTTWGAYTYVKKSTSLGAVSGLLIETLFLTLCLTVATLAFNLPALYPGEIFAPSNNLIWLAGAVSTAPLLMLSYSAGKIPLSLTGFLQFILPATLIILSLFTHDQKPSGTPLALTILIIALLISLIFYELVDTQRTKNKSTHK